MRSNGMRSKILTLLKSIKTKERSTSRDIKDKKSMSKYWLDILVQAERMDRRRTMRSIFDVSMDLIECEYYIRDATLKKTPISKEDVFLA